MEMKPSGSILWAASGCRKGAEEVEELLGRFCSLPKALPMPHLPQGMGSGRAVPFPKCFTPN